MNTALIAVHMIRSVVVGVIAAIVVILCIRMDLPAWAVFLAWAGYFLHGSGIRGGLTMMGGLALGVLSATVAGSVSWETLPPVAAAAATTFLVATFLFATGVIPAFAKAIPACFLGTVVYHAAGGTAKTPLGVMLAAVAFGAVVGWVTVVALARVGRPAPASGGEE